MCSLPDPPPLEGPLKPNNHLHIAERLYEGQVLGPESIVIDHGELIYNLLLADVCDVMFVLLYYCLLLNYQYVRACIGSAVHVPLCCV